MLTELHILREALLSPLLLDFFFHILSSMKSFFFLCPYRMGGTLCQCGTNLAARNTLDFHGRVHVIFYTLPANFLIVCLISFSLAQIKQM